MRVEGARTVAGLAPNDDPVNGSRTCTRTVRRVGAAVDLVPASPVRQIHGLQQWLHGKEAHNSGHIGQRRDARQPVLPVLHRGSEPDVGVALAPVRREVGRDARGALREHLPAEPRRSAPEAVQALHGAPGRVHVAPVRHGGAEHEGGLPAFSAAAFHFRARPSACPRRCGAARPCPSGPHAVDALVERLRVAVVTARETFVQPHQGLNVWFVQAIPVETPITPPPERACPEPPSRSPVGSPPCSGRAPTGDPRHR
jgi:hypothetical protein